MKHLFNTVRTELVDVVRMNHVGGWSQDPSRALSNERQFFNSTPAAIRHAGSNASMTNYILKNYFRPMFSDDEYHHLLVNTYAHHLPSEGLYPNQPIWHCDYARHEVEEDMTPVEEDAEAIHWYLIIGDRPTVPVPQFIDKHNINLDDQILKEKSWVGVSKYIDRKVKSGWHTFAFKPFDLFTFRGNELYRSSVTTEACNRFAMRVTLYPQGHPARPKGTGKCSERKLHMVYVK